MWWKKVVQSISVKKGIYVNSLNCLPTPAIWVTSIVDRVRLWLWIAWVAGIAWIDWWTSVAGVDWIWCITFNKWFTINNWSYCRISSDWSWNNRCWVGRSSWNILCSVGWNSWGRIRWISWCNTISWRNDTWFSGNNSQETSENEL